MNKKKEIINIMETNLATFGFKEKRKNAKKEIVQFTCKRNIEIDTIRNEGNKKLLITLMKREETK